MPQEKKSLFIVFEGLDGAGTTTQVDLLAGYLRNEKPEQKILITKEPTNNIIGGLIRGCLTGDWKTTPDGLQLLFAADRAHHLSQVIEPALRDHYIVICDRYYLSSIAYGSIDCDQEWIYKINKKFRRPDLTFLIDVTAETAMERMKKIRYNVELFERKAILEKVRKNYLDIAQKEKNLHIINGEEIITRVRDDINKFINKYLDT
ncbi:MAG: dTMP kinase [Patescibacteria group bacterium]|nr:dTMP kinase [Patescibacteria group bacterium]